MRIGSSIENYSIFRHMSTESRNDMLQSIQFFFQTRPVNSNTELTREINRRLNVSISPLGLSIVTVSVFVCYIS